MENGEVYLVWAKNTRRFKIGFSTDVEKRISTLSTQSPYPLILLGTHAGDMSLEKHFHQQYKKYRINGEWFEFEDYWPVLLEFNYPLVCSMLPGVPSEFWHIEDAAEKIIYQATSIRGTVLFDIVTNKYQAWPPFNDSKYDCLLPLLKKQFDDPLLAVERMIDAAWNVFPRNPRNNSYRNNLGEIKNNADKSTSGL